MADKIQRILNLYQDGFDCSQILLLLGLEAQGVSNPALVRAMAGLAGGVGSSGHLCGALTGGACLIALYAGKGDVGEAEHERFFLMVDELVDWFAGGIGQKCGGINCAEIADCELAFNTLLPQCCNIVLSTWDKVGEILRKNHIGVSSGGLQ